MRVNGMNRKYLITVMVLCTISLLVPAKGFADSATTVTIQEDKTTKMNDDQMRKLEELKRKIEAMKQRMENSQFKAADTLRKIEAQQGIAAQAEKATPNFQVGDFLNLPKVAVPEPKVIGPVQLNKEFKMNYLAPSMMDNAIRPMREIRVKGFIN